MAEHIGEFKITTSNGSAINKQRSSLRIYRGVEVVVVMYRDPMGSIMRKIRRHPDSQERAEFLSQMRAAGVPDEQVRLILTTEGKKVSRDGKPVERRKDDAVTQQM